MSRHKLRRQNDGQKVVDVDIEMPLTKQSNENRGLSRAKRRKDFRNTQRTDKLKGLQKGHFIEMLCQTASGRKEWFRASVVRKTRQKSTIDHDIYLVRWLEGKERTEVDMRSENVAILGKLEVEPHARRTRKEQRNIAEELRNADDIGVKERTLRSVSRAARLEGHDIGLVTPCQESSTTKDEKDREESNTLEPSIVLSDFDDPIEVDLRALDEREFNDSLLLLEKPFNDEHRAVQVVESWWTNVLERRSLLIKWRCYIRGELRCLLAAEKLAIAQYHIRDATRLLDDMVLPSRYLLTTKDHSKLMNYDHKSVENHDSNAMSVNGSEAILSARKKLNAAVGSHFHNDLIGHVNLFARLEQLKRKDPDAVLGDIASQKYPGTDDTPTFWKADKVRLDAMTLSDKESDMETAEFSEKYRRRNAIHRTNRNLTRLLVNKNNTYPVFTETGKVIAQYLPRKVQDELAERYQNTTCAQDALRKNHEYLASHCRKLKGAFRNGEHDDNVHGILCGSDNVGKGRGKRVETITHWIKLLKYSRLPSVVRPWAKEAHSNWLPMSNTGLEEPAQLAANEESDDLQRLQVIMHLKAITSDVPSLQGEDPGPPPKYISGTRRRRSTPTLVETDQYMDLLEPGNPKITKKKPLKNVERKRSVWDQGPNDECISLLPQIVKPFAEGKNLVKMTELNDKLAKGKSHAEIGDGAPMFFLLRTQRQILKTLRGCDSNGFGVPASSAGQPSLQQSDSNELQRTAYDGSSTTTTSESSRVEVSSQSSSASTASTLLSLGLNCGSETSESSESTVPSTSTIDTERACKVPAQRKQTRSKLCCEGLTRKQMEVLTRSTTLVMGLWHCVQELMVVSLGLFKEEFTFLARLWRGREGRLKFWLNGGSLNDYLRDAYEAVCGIVKWWQARYEKSLTDSQVANVVDFDAFMDEEARSSQVLSRWRDVIEVILLAKSLHDSTRQGMLKFVRLFLKHLTELCAANGNYKYMRWIPEFEIIIATMPDADLAFLHEKLFVDMGSHFVSTDEFTEDCHWLYELVIGRNRNANEWKDAVRNFSGRAAYTSPGNKFGTASGENKTPTGHRQLRRFIPCAVQNLLHDTYGDTTWRDLNGVERTYDHCSGVGGELSLYARDPQRTGRAIFIEDIEKNVFKSGTNSLPKRRRPRNLTVTSEKYEKAKRERESQINAKTKEEIQGAKYTKKEMSIDLKAYSEEGGFPEAVMGALNGPPNEKKELLPTTSALRPIFARAVAKWRALAPDVCARAHAKVDAEMRNEFSASVASEKSMIQRRTEARDRLVRDGRLHGIGVMKKKNDQPLHSKNAATELWRNLEKVKNVAPAGHGDGARAQKEMMDFVSRNHVSEASSTALRNSDEPQVMNRIARELKQAASCADKGMRVQQMEAARSFRKVAEIKALMDERIEAKARNTSGSRWSVPAQEPPAASIGNAIKWRKPSEGNVPSERTTERTIPCSESTRRRQLLQSITGTSKRRQQICSCCSQPRLLGHVKICTHVNKVCSKCRRVNS